MTHQPNREVFSSGAVSQHEKILRLRREITGSREYRRELENAFAHYFGDGHSPLYWKLEKHIVDLRISEMDPSLPRCSTAVAIDLADLLFPSLRGLRVGAKRPENSCRPTQCPSPTRTVGIVGDGL